ncbi:ABC transporter permease [Bacteroidota bacterium]
MDNHEKITVYSPESGIRNPKQLFGDMWSDLLSSRSLGWRLFLRNIRGMYRQSLLGIFWAFIPPIMTTAVWVFLNGQKIIQIDTPDVPYPAFVLTSTLLWSIFAQSLVMPINALNSGKAMMKKINFPKESLILAGILQVGFDFLIKLSLIIVVYIVFSVSPPVTALIAPVGLIMLMLLGISIGLVFVPLGMLYTDIQRLLAAILPFWMLLTPVIYPTPRAGIGVLLNKINPVAPILSTTRDWMFSGSPQLLNEFIVVSIFVIFLFFFGLVLFRLAIPFIIERSGG